MVPVWSLSYACLISVYLLIVSHCWQVGALFTGLCELLLKPVCTTKKRQSKAKPGTTCSKPSLRICSDPSVLGTTELGLMPKYFCSSIMRCLEVVPTSNLLELFPVNCKCFLPPICPLHLGYGASDQIPTWENHCPLSHPVIFWAITYGLFSGPSAANTKQEVTELSEMNKAGVPDGAELLDPASLALKCLVPCPVMLTLIIAPNVPKRKYTIHSPSC